MNWNCTEETFFPLSGAVPLESRKSDLGDVCAVASP